MDDLLSLGGRGLKEPRQVRDGKTILGELRDVPGLSGLGELRKDQALVRGEVLANQADQLRLRSDI